MENFIFPHRKSIAVKICGIRTKEQARNIIALGTDALGFNFWPKSKRYLDPGNALWLRELDGEAIRIGVFVNERNSVIRDLLERNLIDWAQLHGDESPEFVAELQNEGLKVFKAFGVKDRTFLAKGDSFQGPLLLDAYSPIEYGGSGERIDWSLGAEAVKQFRDRDVILAGGLTPSNVAAAVRQVHPAAVDVASGVEASPGVKDLALCEKFVSEVRSAYETKIS